MCLSVYVTGLLVFLGSVFSNLVQDNLPKAKHPHLLKQGGIIWLHTISSEQKRVKNAFQYPSLVHLKKESVSSAYIALKSTLLLLVFVLCTPRGDS